MSLLPTNRTTVLRRLAVFATVCFSLCCGRLYASTPAITLTEYSSNGTDSGTVGLSRNATIAATVTGTSNTSVTWSVQGAGTITTAGIYTAPAAMPSNTTVTVKAVLDSNTSVSASYSMQLLYNPPSTHWTTPSILVSGQTNSVQVGGQDFTAATTIKVNGTSVPAVYQASGDDVLVQIPVAAGDVNSLSIVASNPSPGGGSSAAITVPVKPITVVVSSYSTGQLNPTAIALGRDLQFVATVSGGNPAISWPVTWSLSGGGSLSASGLYEAPTVMPSSWGFTVTASLTANSSISETYHVSLLDPRPVVNGSSPVETTAGTQSVFTFSGENFVPGTTVQVNGHEAATTYLSPNSINAVVYTPSGSTGSMYVTVTNPPPHGSQSGAFLLPVAGTAETVQATVGSTVGRAIPGDFAGLSEEWGAQTYMGTAQTGVDNIYRQLIKNLSNPGSPFFIRIGGGTTDTSGEPNSSTTQAFSDLATAMPVQFSLGVNLGADNVKLAEDQASWFSTHMPAGSLAAIELGNEPDAYDANGWRSSTYNFTDYLADFATWDNGIKPLLPTGVKILGPSLTTIWHLTEDLPSLEAAEESNISIVSSHMYGGYIENNLAPNYLLTDHAVSYELALIGPQAKTAHNDGQLYRIAEMNSVDGGGIVGMSNTFSAALWAADVMFSTVNVGVDGVNFHGTNGCTYCPFNIGMQSENGTNTFRLQAVYPLYYGMLFFHDATQNSANLLPVTVSSSSGANVKVWATQDASGTVRVAILNKDQTFTGNVTVSLPGYGQATAIRMEAPNYLSESGITFGGQTFDNSFDGTLIGTQMTESFTPTDSVYTVPVQPTSAVLLTLTK